MADLTQPTGGRDRPEDAAPLSNADSPARLRRQFVKSAALLAPAIITLRSGAARAALTCAPLTSTTSNTSTQVFQGYPGVDATDVCVVDHTPAGACPPNRVNDIAGTSPTSVYYCQDWVPADGNGGGDAWGIPYESPTNLSIDPNTSQAISDVQCSLRGYTCNNQAVMSSAAFVSIASHQGVYRSIR